MSDTFFTISELKVIYIKSKRLSEITPDTKLKTKYLALASNVNSLINAIETGTHGRYE